MSNTVEAIVSLQRLSVFLASDELQTDARKLIEKPSLRVGDEVLNLMALLSEGLKRSL